MSFFLTSLSLDIRRYLISLTGPWLINLLMTCRGGCLLRHKYNIRQIDNKIMNQINEISLIKHQLRYDMDYIIDYFFHIGYNVFSILDIFECPKYSIQDSDNWDLFVDNKIQIDLNYFINNQIKKILDYLIDKKNKIDLDWFVNKIKKIDFNYFVNKKDFNFFVMNKPDYHNGVDADIGFEMKLEQIYSFPDTKIVMFVGYIIGLIKPVLNSFQFYLVSNLVSRGAGCLPLCGQGKGAG
jgi:hypothetical protein